MDGMRDFKCPNCGGNIEFNSAKQNMKCPYCDSEFDVEALATFDGNLSEGSTEDLTWNETAGGKWAAEEINGMVVYACKACGGEIMADENTGMTNCPYCGNPIAMRERFSGNLKPDYVIPFKVDKKAAKEAMALHMKKKPLLPKSFIRDNHIDEIKGIYVPFWLFDASVDGDFKFKGYTERSWRSGDYEYTEKKYYALYREGCLSFQKVPVDGSTQMPDYLMESIEPYDFSELKPFTMAYLSGYLADKYDVDQDESIKRANERIKESVIDKFESTTGGYSGVTTEASAISYRDGSVKYALLPVWLLQTSWNGENFLFAMNGQTGKFVGNLPSDKGLFWKWFIGSWIIGFLISALISLLVFS